ncbi:hypothetical protein M514_07356 [Trichuris suis]|uniref:mRNA-capping enzyme n=1 Tax=Trichuris suis TaxID=68888 RepID=A0A085NFX6_9BILA|nr:hypothetical protein M513_07356 [Trichuris suis]KFD68372.1 hypothetical protein M514_07356 [Trichuris suis]
MSKRTWSQANNELEPPQRWLRCPRKGKVISGIFLPFKTPLSHKYDKVVPEENRFYPSMVLKADDLGGKKIGLWIDLTNTRRFYDKKEIEDAGVEYVKLNCKGFGECPSEEQVRRFVDICKNFSERSDKIVGIFPRFFFLLKFQKRHVDAAIAAFVSARPPGMYKQEYLKVLYERFDDMEFTPVAPELPEWCLDEPDEQEEDKGLEPDPKRAEVSEATSPSFAGNIPDVTYVSGDTAASVCEICRYYCSYEKMGFPGSQPVSLNRENINMLQLHPYMVTWKANGTRYLMFIDGKHRTFLIDGHNNVFVAPTLTFLQRDGRSPLTRTLVDGELVFDIFAGKKVPRYLIYDVIVYCDDLVRERPFHDRHEIIHKCIISPRMEALCTNRIIRDNEPFGIRQKPFFELSYIDKVLSMDVSHGTDGVILQRVDEVRTSHPLASFASSLTMLKALLQPYTGGRCPALLKWKLSNFNSVDFLLQIERENREEGSVSQYVGNLMVLDAREPFDKMPVTKDLLKYNHKIIECTVTEGVWTFVRERTDKSLPNSYETALGVRKSIRFPITKDELVHFVKTMSLKYKLVPGSFVPVERAPSAPDSA